MAVARAPRGAFTAPCVRGVGGYGLDLYMGVDGSGTECTAVHHGQIGPIIPHGGSLTPTQTQRGKGLLGSRPLVFGAKVGMGNTQSPQAHPQRL